MGGNSLAEYLVSLGVKVDEAGFKKVHNTLFKTKATVLGITAALAAMTYGIAKASNSLSESRLKFEDMAKSGKKSAEAIAQQEIALKVMGKTLAEVNKNERLKKTLEALKGVGQEIKLPAAGEGKAQIEGLMVGLQKLKVTATYAMHWINNEFLNKMAFPIKKLKDDLEDLRKKLVLNLPKISAKIGSFLADFMRLMIAGVNGIKDFGDYITALPPIVHQAMLAFGGLWGVMKASPLFWILGGLMSLLILLDDFQAYKRGSDKTAFGGIWEMFDQEGGIGKGISDALDAQGFDNVGDFAGNFIKNLYTELFGSINTALASGKIQEWGLKLEGVTEAIADNIISAFKTFDVASFTSQAAGVMETFTQTILDVIFGADAKSTNVFGDDRTKFTPATKGLLTLANDIAGAMLTALTGEADKIEWGDAGQKISAFVNKLVIGLGEKVTEFFAPGKTFESAIAVATSITKGIAEAVMAGIKELDLGAGISTALDAGDTILTSIMDTIFGTPDTQVFDGQFMETVAGKKGLLDSVEKIVKEFGKTIVEKITGVEWEISGAQIGTMFTNLFKKIGDYFKNKSADDESVFTDVVGVAKAIVGGILSALSGFFSTANPTEIADSIGDFIDGLMVMFTKAFLDENNQVTDIGTQIGQALGDAIKFTGDLILRIAQRLADSFSADGVGSKFVSVGLQIADDIATGIMQGLGDVVGRIFFGKKGWKQRQDEIKLREASKTGKVVYRDENDGIVSPKDVPLFVSQNTELAKQQYESQFDWQAAMKEVEAGFGGRYVTPLGRWGSNQKSEDWQKSYGFFMNPLSNEKTELDKRIRGVEYGRDTQNPEEYKKRLEYLLAYIEAFKNGARGEDLMGAGSTVEVPAELSLDVMTELEKAQKAISAWGPVTVGGKLVMGSEENVIGNATGGRYNTPQRTTISETGQTEYVIPMDRPERAKGLILQMLSEMGSGAKDILSSFGVNQKSFSGMNNRLAMAGSYPVGGNGSVKSNSDNTVTSNPTINVYGSSDAVMTGRVAYEASEQVLVRHLRGVLGS